MWRSCEVPRSRHMKINRLFAKVPPVTTVRSRCRDGDGFSTILNPGEQRIQSTALERVLSEPISVTRATRGARFFPSLDQLVKVVAALLDATVLVEGGETGTEQHHFSGSCTLEGCSESCLQIRVPLKTIITESALMQGFVQLLLHGAKAVGVQLPFPCEVRQRDQIRTLRFASTQPVDGGVTSGQCC